jgi:hypothetical protein
MDPPPGFSNRVHLWRGGTSCTPSKDFEKFGHKIATKHENRGPPRFSHKPQYPPQKNLKTTVRLWNPKPHFEKHG